MKLTQAMLTDGPWCPDATSAELRYDADLLRLRASRIKLRVQVALGQLRGPAGALFRHGGHVDRGGSTWCPTRRSAFDITPRNMNLGR